MDNVYTFTVVATDIMSGSTRLNNSVDVTVTVTDVEEEGKITVDNSNPAVADVLRFELSDPDGGIVTGASPGGFSWTIQTRTSDGADWVSGHIENAGEFHIEYLVDEDHAGRQMRAVVDSYTDRRGPGKNAESEATAAITADPIVNAPPRFRGGGSQSFPEGEAGRDLDEPLRATDRDNDTLTFGIQEGQSSALFEINASTGQLRITQALDYETLPGRKILFFTVTVHDGRDADGNVEADPVVDTTTTVTITVTDVEEPGVITFSAEEPEVGVPLIATLEDGDGPFVASA